MNIEEKNMISKSSLKRLLTFENISFERKACLNDSNRLTVCNACINACPTQAIKLHSNIPDVNPLTCVDCGTCIGECPVLAFDHTQYPYEELLNQIKKHPNAQITCTQAENYQYGIKIPCYLYLDIPLLLKYSKGKEQINLYIGACNSCSKSDGRTIQQHMEKLQKQLTAHQLDVRIQYSDLILDKTKDVMINGLTRRELLKMVSMTNIKQIFWEKGGEVEEEKLKNSKKGLNTRERTKHKMLLKRRVFHQYLYQASENKEDMTSKDFLSIKILQSCIGCNICEKICPTDALKWVSNGNESSLIFSIQSCISCKKCYACPTESIQFEKASIKTYLQGENKVLITFQTNQCISCGENFRSFDGKSTCYICTSKAEKKPEDFFQ